VQPSTVGVFPENGPHLPRHRLPARARRSFGHAQTIDWPLKALQPEPEPRRLSPCDDPIPALAPCHDTHRQLNAGRQRADSVTAREADGRRRLWLKSGRPKCWARWSRRSSSLWPAG
jgi:hypothetical protein